MAEGGEPSIQLYHCGTCIRGYHIYQAIWVPVNGLVGKNPAIHMAAMLLAYIKMNKLLDICHVKFLACALRLSFLEGVDPKQLLDVEVMMMQGSWE